MVCVWYVPGRHDVVGVLTRHYDDFKTLEEVSRKWMIENKMGDRHALTASLEFASLAAFNRAPLLHIIYNS